MLIPIVLVIVLALISVLYTAANVLSKGTVSRELRLVLLYINRKLFWRAIVGHHKILILLKGLSHKN